MNEWGERTIIAHFVSSLRGRAQQFSSELDHETLFDLNRLLRAFGERFDQASPPSVYRTQLRTREQRHGESLAEFTAAIRDLARAAYIGRPHDLIEELAVEQFLNGIRDVDVQIATRDSNPTSLTEARDTAIQLAQNRRLARTHRKTIGTAAAQVTMTGEVAHSRQPPAGNANEST